MLLEKKTALITGCNRGIGRAMLHAFCREGAFVWAHARRETDSFTTDIRRLEDQYGVVIQPLYFDLTDESAIKNGVRQFSTSKNRVDILVNNAGIVGENRLFQMTPMQDMRKVFEVNFFAATLLMQYISRVMVRQKAGSIVNIASVAGLDGDPAQYEYSASKAALIGGSKKAAIELGPYGVRVNALAPGLTETEMAGHMQDKMKQSDIESTILGRLAKPEEIANAAVFLASDLASFITGQVLRVDGGKL